MSAQQLTLDIRLPDQAVFSNFFTAGNERVMQALEDVLVGSDPLLVLYGQQGSGRTHLLQATCHAAHAKGLSAAYLPLDGGSLSPAMLEGLEHYDVVCLDGASAVLSQIVWEEALFHFYHRCLETGTRWIVALDGAPGQVEMALPDLQSRLSQGLALQIQLLSDEQKIQALQMRSKQRGFELPEAVAQYLLSHFDRELGALLGMLDRLDLAALEEERRLTIPFVKQALRPESP